MKNVAVFFGGKSAEREISILTGVLAVKMIDPAEYRAIPVYIHTDGCFYTSKEVVSLDAFKRQPLNLKDFLRCYFENGEMLIVSPKSNRIKSRKKIDVALNCCHGGAGENGGIAALCELYCIPSASPDTAACALAMDKELTKIFLSELGLPVLPYFSLERKDYVRRGESALAGAQALGFPLIVKPACSGSSIGIAVISDKSLLKSAAEEAFLYGDKLIFEPFLEKKRDVNCAAYRVKDEICVSEPETAFSGGVYSFKEKYLSNREKDKQGGVSAECAEAVRAYTKKIYKRLQTLGVIRVDFLIDDRADECCGGDACDSFEISRSSGETGRIYVGEINAVPGSLAYYLFCERLIDGRRFLSDLLSEPFFGSRREIEIPETEVLKSVATGGKRGFTGVRV